MFEESTIVDGADQFKDKRSIYKYRRLSKEDKQELYSSRPDLSPQLDEANDESPPPRRVRGLKMHLSSTDPPPPHVPIDPSLLIDLLGEDGGTDEQQMSRGNDSATLGHRDEKKEDSSSSSDDDDDDEDRELRSSVRSNSIFIAHARLPMANTSPNSSSTSIEIKREG